MAFRPQTGFPPGTRVTVTVATGGSGTRSESSSFGTGAYSTLPYTAARDSYPYVACGTLVTVAY